MKRIYQSNKTAKIVLTFFLLFIILGPPIISFFSTDELWLALTVCGIVYLAYLPIIWLLKNITIKYRNLKIIITGEYIEYHLGKDMIRLNWNEIDFVHFDYLEIPGGNANYNKYYILYELGRGEDAIRFYRFLNKYDKIENIDFTPVKLMEKKSYSIAAYGVNLNYKDCNRLVGYISDYTGIELKRKLGLF